MDLRQEKQNKPGYYGRLTREAEIEWQLQQGRVFCRRRTLSRGERREAAVATNTFEESWRKWHIGYQ